MFSSSLSYSPLSLSKPQSTSAQDESEYAPIIPPQDFYYSDFILPTDLEPSTAIAMARARTQRTEAAKTGRVNKLRRFISRPNPKPGPKTPRKSTKSKVKNQEKKATDQVDDCPNFVLLGFQQNRPFKDIYKAFVRHGITDHGEMTKRMQEQWGSCPNHKDSLRKYWYTLQIEQRQHFTMLRRERSQARRARRVTGGPVDLEQPDEPLLDSGSETEASEVHTPKRTEDKRSTFKFKLNRTFESAMKALKPRDQSKVSKTPTVTKSVYSSIVKGFKDKMTIGELLDFGKGKKKKQRGKIVMKEADGGGDIEGVIGQLAGVKLSEGTSDNGGQGGDELESVTKRLEEVKLKEKKD
ncbi:hypothetical protein TWF281_008046 [Arthrobotrys megalospora]